MAYKTFSQKAARFFEIAGYVLLVPAVISIIYTFIYEVALFLIPASITCVGLLLLLGYRKHTQGKFDKDKLYLLWFGTLVFNGVPLVSVLCKVIFISNRSGINFALFTDLFFIGSALLTLWWIIAVSLSITLILDVFRNWA